MFSVHSSNSSLSILFRWCVPACGNTKRNPFADGSAPLCLRPPPPKYGEIFTHHSFHESARGICTTVVLGQDCTGSEEQFILFFRCVENADYAVQNYNQSTNQRA